ncbi:LytR/AlgR family response regulator transcription factor [Faecalimicrobium sp. JNUCC 81]
MLRIAICDDDLLHRSILCTYVSTILNDDFLEYNLVEYCSGEELLRDYKSNFLDILFLDIKMNELSGMDTARKIREFDGNVEIIFTTSIPQYVYEAYEVKAYRYLLKPLEYSDIKKQLKLCISEYLSRQEVVSIESNKKTLVIPIGEILYAEVLRKEVTIYTENEEYKIEISMKKIEKKLLNYNFFRCHHSYLVNLKKINELKDKSIFINDIEIPVSRLKYKDLKIRLLNVLGDSLC